VSALTDRMPRLLALVPYLQAHPGVRVEEAAADLAVTPTQLRRDLELLWMCGLPGYGPGELIDLSFEGDTVSVVFDAGLTRPLRLSHAEAGALAVCLRALGDVGGVVGRDVVERTLAKVEAAAGGASASGVAQARGDVEPDEAVTTAVGAALAGRRTVAIRYVNAGRDEVTDRVVEPRELVVVNGRSYLEAWCRRAEGVRLFRLDRVERAEVLDEVLPPRAADEDDRAASGSPFDLGEDLPLAELVLAPSATWVAEQYPVESLTALPDGGVRVGLRYSDPEWLVRTVLGFGGAVQVQAPADVAEEVRRRAAAALAAYPDAG
jgi:proteasome accessory factor C